MVDIGSFLAPLGAVLGAFIGAYLSTLLREKRIARRRHFARLKSRILEPWLNSFSSTGPYTEYGFLHNVNFPYGKPMSSPLRELGLEHDPLFLDLPKHFPPLTPQWLDFVEEMKRHDHLSLEFTVDLGNQLQEKTGLRISQELLSPVGVHHAFLEVLYLRLLSKAGANIVNVIDDFGIVESGDHFSIQIPGHTYGNGTKEQMEAARDAYVWLANLEANKQRAAQIIESSKRLLEKLHCISLELRGIVELNRLSGNCMYVRA